MDTCSVLHRQTVYMMSALCVPDMKLRDVCVQVMEKSVREIQVTEFLWELGGWLRLYRGCHTLTEPPVEQTVLPEWTSAVKGG